MRKRHPLRAIAVLAATWVLLGAAPVSAHEGQIGALLLASDDPITISGDVEGGLLYEITSIPLTVRSDGPQPEPPQTFDGCELPGTGCRGGIDRVTFLWSPEPPARNGPYVVEGAIEHRHCVVFCEPAPRSRATPTSFTVAVPPEAPTGLNALYADGQVTLTWGAVPPYPDLIGYLVYRKSGSGSFTPIASAVGTSFVDRSPPAGATEIDYQVIAYRPGGDGKSDPKNFDQWLASPPVTGRAAVPSGAAPTTVPGGGDGGSHGGGGSPSANADLGSFFAGASNPGAPSSPTEVTLPDTGFNPNLPFPANSGKLEGRNPGRPSSAAGSGAVEPGGDLTDSNRRALLIPVAAGSVLCVAALHLRWLSRRLVVSPMGSSVSSGDLEPAPFDQFDGDEFGPSPEPVGASAGGGTPASSR